VVKPVWEWVWWMNLCNMRCVCLGATPDFPPVPPTAERRSADIPASLDPRRSALTANSKLDIYLMLIRSCWTLEGSYVKCVIQS
jgi:hypothetical protein